jgi:type VI protein secretion system component VasF
MTAAYVIASILLGASALGMAALILAHMLGWGLELDQQSETPQ